MSDNKKEFVFSLRCANCDFAPTMAQAKKGKNHGKCEKAYSKEAVGCEKYDHNKIKIAK